METLDQTQVFQYTEELSRLFYAFRTAHLNRRYYAERLKKLRGWDKLLQILIALLTASSVGLLVMADFPHVKTVAALLSVAAFVATFVVPAFGLTRSIDEASSRSCAWHYAAQQIENAMKRVKVATNQDGEVRGWVESAEDVYGLAAATPDSEALDKNLRKEIEDEINESFPPEYVWTAF